MSLYFRFFKVTAPVERAASCLQTFHKLPFQQPLVFRPSCRFPRLCRERKADRPQQHLGAGAYQQRVRLPAPSGTPAGHSLRAGRAVEKARFSAFQRQDVHHHVFLLGCPFGYFQKGVLFCAWETVGCQESTCPTLFAYPRPIHQTSCSRLQCVPVSRLCPEWHQVSIALDARFLAPVVPGLA